MPKGAAWDTPNRRAARARMRAGDGFLYVAGFVGSDVLKLGFSLAPSRRVKELNCGHGKPFLLAVAPGTYRQERSLHGKLAEHSIRRRVSEMYRPSVLNHPAFPAELRERLPAEQSSPSASP